MTHWWAQFTHAFKSAANGKVPAGGHAAAHAAAVHPLSWLIALALVLLVVAILRKRSNAKAGGGRARRRPSSYPYRP